jgi:tetraacyldisaccharide 4'-kinase
VRELWLAAARGEACGPAGLLLVAGLVPLEWLYRCGLAAYLAAERAGLRRRERLDARVVSIGNLTLGGTGKTGLTEALARRLSRDRRCAVLLRGYGGRGGHAGLMVSDGSGPAVEWAQCGDEAALLAASLPGVAVLAGKDRRVTGRMAIRQTGAELLLLDDGLQYWQLHRDLDIVLVDARSPFGNGHVVPAGLLREPAGGLRRAGAVVISHANEIGADRLERLRGRIRRMAPSVEVFAAWYSPVSLTSPDGGEEPAESLRGRRVMALCGIGSPASFSATLRDAGAHVAAEWFLPDHHPFCARELETAERIAKDAGAEWIVTTPKDAVRLSGLRLPDRLRVLRAEIMVEGFERLAALAAGGGA